MVIDFSKVNCSEKPTLLLKNLDGTVIDVIGLAFNVSADLSYNEVSSISFDVPSHVDNESVPYYDKIVGYRLVELVGIGQFMLIDPSEEDDGIRKVKTCKAYSLEYEFAKKNIYLEAGTYNFFSGINVSNEDTIVGRIKEKLPDWTFTIDTSLIGKYRTFEDTDKKVYDFIKSDVQESFGCIFNFDTETRSVSVISASSTVNTKQVYLSNESLIKEIQIDEDSDSIVTCLDVNGDDDINIRSVNPTGTNKIYNLDYFMTTDYFSQSTIDKWHQWETDYENARSEYYDIMMSYNLTTLNITMQENELSDLNAELQTIENLQAVIIQGISSGLKQQSDLDTVNAQITAKKAEITAKEAEITTLKTSAASTLTSLIAINTSLAFEQYFTTNEITVLKRYFIEDTVQDSSFVPSSSATYSNEDLNGDIANKNIAVTGATITSTTKSSKQILSIAGGSVAVDTITADIVKGTVEVDTTSGSFVFTAYLNSGLVSASSFKSGNLTISGSTNAGTVSITDSVSFTMAVTSGRLYFTKNSTVYEEHQIEWDLYEYGKSVLAEHASPTYNFKVECANFLTSDDYLLFHNQLKLGERVYLEINEEVIQPYVVAVHIDFESQDGFSIDFSSSYNSFDKTFALSKLLEQSVSMGKTLSYKSGAYSSFVNSGASNMVKEFMDSSLDIAKKAVLSSGNQAITYSDTGMRVRKWSNESKTAYEPEEIWIVDNMIAFTDDNWATAKMAIGKIFDQNFMTGYALTEDTTFVDGKSYYTCTNGRYTIANVTTGNTVTANTYYEYTATNNTVYGIAAPYLVGTMIAGENLFIESTKPDGQNMSFKVDGSGASLYNAKFTLKDSYREIILDPKLGLGIGTGSIINEDDDGTETWNTDGSHAKFWVDTNGNVHIKGALEGCTGTFSGELSAARGSFEGDVSGGSIHIGSNGSGGYNFVVDSNGNMTALSGTFKGTLDSCGGSFNGSLSAASGTFNGTLNACGGTFNGSLSAATGTFKGSLQAATGTFAGNLSAAGGTFSGSLSAATGTFSGSLSAATGTFAGSLSAASGSFTGDVSGGSIHIGSNGTGGYNFVVDSSGNMTAASGSFSGALNATAMSFDGTNILTNTTVEGNATSTSKISSSFLDLGNITLNGTTGDITLGGNIYISGNIQWNSSNSPISVQYSADASSWHTTLASSDYYARYSYDGGTTWTDGIKVKGVDGTNGVDGDDGSDASVTYANICRALYSTADDGIYAYDGKICVCASYIKSGVIDADAISLSSNYGGFCCGQGFDGTSTTTGSKMYGSGGSCYVIATNAGVRMTAGESFWVDDDSICATSAITTTSDRRFKNTISSDMSEYVEFYKKLKPSSYKFNNGKSGRLHIGFIAQEVEEALALGGLTTQDFAGIVQCSGENDSHIEYTDEYSLRYSEFIALNTYMIQGLIDKVENLENEIRELKGV